MNRIESINTERIRWCANERGVSLEQAAEEAGIPQRALADLLDNEVGLTFAQLRKLADYFGRGVLFFLDSGPVDEQQVHSVQYRTLTNQKPELSPNIRKLIERVEHQRELYLALREELHPEDYPVFAPVNVFGRRPAEAAVVVRQWLGLDQVNTFDGFRRAVEAKGILVFRSNGYAGRWQIAKESPIIGFSIWSDICPVIVVKKTRAESQQSFTLMHELGHLLLHGESSIDDDADMHSQQGNERAANAFAGHLLVPDAWLAQVRDDERPAAVEQYELWLAPFRQRWGVSTEVILRRLLDLGRLPQERYTAYRTFLHGRKYEDDEGGGSRAYRHREPKHIFGDMFVKTVLSALGSRKITATKACSYLDGLKLTDLHSLERYVAGA
ncbi:ImmA/IrrE family metallo-endopeptidase [Comamonadaceae bacterium G21597-S1]|nr:ImmA/IrrE family metallo-endopeptidase [Comamonadaceae bacterium G21597-S1]